MMKDWDKNFQAWKAKRHLKLYESWKKSPQMTAVGFILFAILFLSLLITIFDILFDYYLLDEFSWNTILQDFIRALFTGVLCGTWIWWQSHKALQKRLQEESDGKTYMR